MIERIDEIWYLLFFFVWRWYHCCLLLISLKILYGFFELLSGWVAICYTFFFVIQMIIGFALLRNELSFDSRNIKVWRNHHGMQGTLGLHFILISRTTSLGTQSTFGFLFWIVIIHLTFLRFEIGYWVTN